MQISRIISILLLIEGIAISFEPDMLNLRVPSRIEKNKTVFEIRHRFYGKVNENAIDTHFGIDAGANVGVGIRYVAIKNLEIKGSYTRNQKEYTAGASYAYFFEPFFTWSQIDICYFDYKIDGIEERRRNLFYQASLQPDPLFRAFMPVVNLAYDGYNQKAGLGAGLAIGFDFEFGPVEHVSMIGEYYPVMDPDSLINGAENSLCFGLKLDTYGHNFMFLIGNSTEIGVRRSMLGAANNDLHIGFVVKRKI